MQNTHAMPSTTLQAEQLYTSEEVSEYLHVSLRTVQRLLQAGALKSFRIHGQYRIKGLDLFSYLDGVRRDPEQPDSEDGSPARLLEQLEVHPISLELAVNLTHLVDPGQNPAFLPALQELRKAISLDLGFIMPGVRLCDDLGLTAGHYRICIHNQAIGQGQLEVSASGPALEQLLAHLERVIRQFAHEILSREEVFVMVEYLRPKHTVVLEEVLSLDGPQPGKLTIGQLTRILRGLLAEQVSIRNLPLILEVLADQLEVATGPEQLLEKLRQGLARQICTPLADEQGVIAVVGLDPASEEALRQACGQPRGQPSELTRLARQLQQQLAQQQNCQVLLCAPDLRLRLRELLWRNFGHWQVLSYQEIERSCRLELKSSIDLLAGAAG